MGYQHFSKSAKKGMILVLVSSGYSWGESSVTIKVWRTAAPPRPDRVPCRALLVKTCTHSRIPTHHPRVYNIHSRNVTRYPANSIVVVGGCPVCRVGVLEDSFTFLGIFLAIILFPFGFICCFALRKRRCPNCGANFT
uniref:Membrane protein BRI3 n=1 Tax=Lynx canadensis TaxID=61383 RepID=A0A667HP80_LYNCA